MRQLPQRNYELTHKYIDDLIAILQKDKRDVAKAIDRESYFELSAEADDTCYFLAIRKIKKEKKKCQEI